MHVFWRRGESTVAEVRDDLVYQIGALIAFTRDKRLQHVKPHGALYNMAARDAALAATVAAAVRDIDKDLILFATGLGRTTPAVASGAAAGSNPLAAVSNVSVTIGGHPMIVSWAGLTPGFVGLYQINIRVPGDRVQGDALPVVVSVGSTSSTASGAAAPLTAIH
jgi:uncharacterized protein (TIGR03437 family)